MKQVLKKLVLRFPALRRLHQERDVYAKEVGRLTHQLAKYEDKRTRCKMLFLVGYWGYGIVGDDAILSALLADLKECFGQNVEITATSYRPKRTTERFGIDAIEFDDLSRVIESVKSSDLVIVAGGGAYNEYDPWCTETRLGNAQGYNVFCAMIPYLCNLAKIPCFICGVGVEPIYSDIAKQDIARAFGLATVATVRDSGSLEVIKSCGISANFPTVTMCPASRTRTRRSDYVDHIRQEARNHNRFLVGVSLRHWDYEHWRYPAKSCAWEDWLAGDLRDIQAKFNCEFLFIPFQAAEEFGDLGNDIPIMRRVINKANISNFSHIWDSPLEPENVAYGLSVCNMVIACRFHSVILSLASGVPVCALSYSKKVRPIMTDANFSEFVVDLESALRGSLTETVIKLLNRLPDVSAKVRSYRKVMRDKGLKNIEIIASFLIADRRQQPDPRKTFLLTYLALIAQRERVNSDIEHVTTELNMAISNSLGSAQESKLVVEILEPLIDKIDDGQIIYYYALALHQSGENSDLALDYYNKALARGADEFWVRYNRGTLLYSIGKIDLAESDWRAVLSLPCLLNEPKEHILRSMPYLSPESTT
ncbi:polysaccharide pyruvyl transferase family protein [Candidatus Thiosymbion oneisti]|uniref:polysaccharide pyruvyl transferase family protein n=1 Tax=Candidatus Thiosymbion oneisti TaxID=589554 RepID=UPI000B7FED54|nr:polysaccharide pyruvyl transferase family protein [Candidatus Thiosymbion oneisti]